MLKTANDFESSIQFLMDGLSIDMSEGILNQTEILNSNDFNTTMETIESRLNVLYEKSRVMTEVIAYAKEFLEQQLYTSLSECHTALNNIEEQRDKIKGSAYISYEVPILASTGPYTDRDNSELSHCDINNNVITLSGQDSTSIPYKSIEKVKGLTPYRNNLAELKDGKVYRSFYLLDGPVNGGLMEEILVTFDTPTLLNYIETVPSNCILSNVRFKLENDSIMYQDDLKTGIVKEQKIKSMQFTLICSNYEKVQYNIDAKRVDANFWETVKEKEYSDMLRAPGTPIIDLDKVSGMDLYKKAFKEYTEAVALWEDRKLQIEKINKMNGY